MRVEQILDGQSALFKIPRVVEKEAQHICAKILALRGDSADTRAGRMEADFCEVDVNSVDLNQPRSVGTEHVSLHALEELGLPEILDDLGFNGRQKATALAEKRKGAPLAGTREETLKVLLLFGIECHIHYRPNSPPHANSKEWIN